MKKIALTVIVLTLFLACKKEDVKMGKVFKKDGLEITFQDFNDSRCPMDATCIWAGEAEAYVKAKHDGVSTDYFWLKLGVTDTVFDYEVTLSEMLPYPTADNHMSDKTAKFLINKL